MLPQQQTLPAGRVRPSRTTKTLMPLPPFIALPLHGNQFVDATDQLETPAKKAAAPTAATGEAAAALEAEGEAVAPEGG